MIKLTIAIPSYNRPAQLAGTVERLLPQLTPEVEIVVLDNHSRDPLAAVLAPLRAVYPDAQLTVVRHSANIGGNANIIRCLEAGSGAWVWTLSDDDKPTADAVARILEGMSRHSECACINFCTSIQPKRTAFETASLTDFLKRLDSFGNLLFITANVYQRVLCKNYLLPALAYTHSCASQIIPFLAALCDEVPVATSDLYISDFIIPSAEQGWPSYFFFYFYEIVEILPDIRAQRALARIIDANVIDLTPSEFYRWAICCDMSYPTEPSALLFLAKGSWMRSQYAANLGSRLRWSMLSYVSAYTHRHFRGFLACWRWVHRLKYGQELPPFVMTNSFRAHFSRREEKIRTRKSGL